MIGPGQRTLIWSLVLGASVLMTVAQESESCGICHKDHYREWLQSPHSQAWKSPEFQAQLAAVGSEDHCGKCHAPISVWKKVELEPSGSLSDSGFRETAYKPSRSSLSEVRESSREEGINCGSCHLIQVVWPPGGSADDFVGPYHTIAGHGGREAPDFDAFQLCGNCHGRAASDYTPLGAGDTAAFHHEENLAFEFQDGVNCSSCHMPATEGKLVQLSVFKDLPDRAIREHSFAANHYKGLKDALELSIGSSGTVVELVNKSVGHPPQISAETEYWLVVTKGQEKEEIRIEGARTWEPGTTLEVPLPFPHEAPESIQVDFVRKGKGGFRERLIRVLL